MDPIQFKPKSTEKVDACKKLFDELSTYEKALFFSQVTTGVIVIKKDEPFQLSPNFTFEHSPQE